MKRKVYRQARRVPSEQTASVADEEGVPIPTFPRNRTAHERPTDQGQPSALRPVARTEMGGRADRVRLHHVRAVQAYGG